MNVNQGIEKRPALPPGWRWARLKEICNFRHGGTPSKSNPDNWSGTIPWISPKDMKTDLILDTEDHVSDIAINRGSVYLIPTGTILIVVRSGILARRFPVAMAGRDAAFNQDIKAILPNKAIINPSFLFFFYTLMKVRLSLME